MFIYSLVFTLTGSAQALTGFKDLAHQVIIQADSANSHVVNLGDSAVSSSVYGIQVPVPASSVPAAPIIIFGPVQVDSIFALGTTNEKLRVTIVSV